MYITETICSRKLYVSEKYPPSIIVDYYFQSKMTRGQYTIRDKTHEMFIT